MATKPVDWITETLCLICEADNAPEALLCSKCFAPMAIVHDAVVQEREPRIVSVIGESNVGKTVLLGFLLDMLAQRRATLKRSPRGPIRSTCSKR